jgi:hypothetical protein
MFLCQFLPMTWIHRLSSLPEVQGGGRFDVLKVLHVPANEENPVKSADGGFGVTSS